MRMRSALLFALAAFVAAAGVGLWAGTSLLEPTPEQRRAALQRETGATILPADYARLPAVDVRTAAGRPLREALAGGWSLLFLGFTHCPDVCPLTLQTLAATTERMGASDMPRVVFISVDPRRDSPADAARYAANFNPGFVGASGAMPALRNLAATLRVDFRVPEAAPEANYFVEHPSQLFLLDPQGRLRAIFSPPLQPGSLAADLRSILESLGET